MIILLLNHWMCQYVYSYIKETRIDRYSRSIRRKELKYFSCSLESAHCSSSSFYLLPVFENSFEALVWCSKNVQTLDEISQKLFNI